MKILHLLSQTQITGAESFAHELSNEMAKNGHEIFFASDDLFLRQPTHFLKIPVDRAKGFQFLKSKYLLRKYLKQNKIEVIHAHSRAAARLGFSARGQLKIGMVTTFHGLHPASWSKRLRNIYGERSHAICKKVKDWNTKELWMDANTIDTIGNPFSAKFCAIEEPLNLESFHLTYVTRASGPKGNRLREFLRQVVFDALESMPGLNVKIYGVNETDLESELLEFIENEFLKRKIKKDRLKILGKYSDSSVIFQSTDILMGSGRVAIEGILSGTPVLCAGEHRFSGLVTKKEFSELADDNFGDIGQNYFAMSSSDFIKALHASTKINYSERKELANIATSKYSVTQVSKKVFRSYQLAIFKRHQPTNIPVLMYHKVPNHDVKSKHRIFVKKELFEKQMEGLYKNNFTPIGFSDLKSYLDGEINLASFPKKPILLTFDDGYADNLTNAAPILKKFNFKAIIFLLADSSFAHNTWDPYEADSSNQLLSRDERQKLILNFQFEVGSHGSTHRHLTQIPPSEALKELRDSKESLEKEFNQKVLSFAYPFGTRNESLSNLCEESGYEFAVNTDEGGSYILDDPYSIFRVNIFPEDRGIQFFKKTSSWYRSYFRFKKGK